MPTPRTVARAPEAATAAAVVARAPEAAAIVVKKPLSEEGSPPSPSAPLLPAQLEEPAICRLCWGEAADDDELLSPCSCSGSLKFIHAHCLQDWQRTLRAQGQGRRAHICELCKTPYRLQQGSSSGQLGGSARQLPRRLLTAVRNSLFDAVYRTPWPSLAVQLWHGYVMTHGAVQVCWCCIVCRGLSCVGHGISPLHCNCLGLAIVSKPYWESS